MQKRSLYFIAFLVVGVVIGALVSPLIRGDQSGTGTEHIASRQVVSTSGTLVANTTTSNTEVTPDASNVTPSNPRPGDQQVAIPVRVETASRRDLSLRLDLRGTLSPKLDVGIVPKVSGRVETVLVDVGDYVNVDETLLVLEDDELVISEQQAQAAVKVAESNLIRVQTGARPQEIELVEAQVDQATANLEQAQSNYERMNSLYESRSISKAQLEQSRAQYDVALSSLKAAESQLELTRLGAQKEEIEAAKAQLAQAQSGLQLARLHLENAQLTSPVTGVVASRMIDPGSFAGAGTPVFQIVQVDPIVLRVEVSGREVVHVKPGLSARISTDAFPGQSFPGTVRIVESVAHSGSRLFGVRIEAPNEKGMLRAGMASRVQIVIDEIKDAVTVPEIALLTGNTPEGSASVFVVSNDTARRRDITLGLISDGWAEVKEGIDPGEFVIVSGHQFLSDGDLVTVIESGTTGRNTR